MITWDEPNKRYYQQGLDRGVLYIGSAAPIPWNGLQNFDEGSEGTTELLYRDGKVFLADADASDFGGQLKSIMYPDQFGACIGIPKVADGFFVDNQKPKRFSMSYRTLVGSGTEGDMFGYQIHLVYNCMATIAPRSRQTLNGDANPVEFNFNVTCTPVKLPGYRPTAHYVIDTRGLSQSTIEEIEGILYGVGETPGRMPEPLELYEMLNFGSAMIFHVHNDGTFTVSGSSDNLEFVPPHSFLMSNINAVDNGDGTYLVSDGGDTDVIIDP